MTETIIFIQTAATHASDLLLCIGAVAFIWLVNQEGGL